MKWNLLLPWIIPQQRVEVTTALLLLGMGARVTRTVRLLRKLLGWWGWIILVILALCNICLKLGILFCNVCSIFLDLTIISCITSMKTKLKQEAVLQKLMRKQLRQWEVQLQDLKLLLNWRVRSGRKNQDLWDIPNKMLNNFLPHWWSY